MQITTKLRKQLIIASVITLAAILIVLAIRAAILYTPTVTHHYSDPVKGKAEAPVQLVEYSDFQCPYCKDLVPMLNKVLTDYGDQISVEYNDFPLIQAHPNAMAAAEAAQCALQQHKFWEYHDTLFNQQTSWNALPDPTSNFVQYAVELQLNSDQFSQCLNNHEQKATVTEDIAEGNSKRISGTPTLFVNGEKYDLEKGYNGSTGYAGLQALIKKYLPDVNANTNVSS